MQMTQNFENFDDNSFIHLFQKILETLKPEMTKPEITRCSDNHYWRVIYSLAAYIADYPEQALFPSSIYRTRYLQNRGTKILKNSQHLIMRLLPVGYWKSTSNTLDTFGLVGTILTIKHYLRRQAAKLASGKFKFFLAELKDT